MKKFFFALGVSVLSATLFTQNLLAQKVIHSELVASYKKDNPSVSLEKLRRMGTFNMVWQSIKDNYFDRTFGGLSWDKIKTEFEPRAAAARDDAELHLLLQEMINRLNKSHFMIIPPEVFREIDRAKADIVEKIEESEFGDEEGGDASDLAESEDKKIEKPLYFGVGIDIRFIENEVVVTRIEKDSPAEKSGLKTGFIIEKINGVSLKSFLETFRRNTVYAKVYEKQLTGLLLSFIDSPTDEGFVSLGITDGKEQPKEIKIKREALKGELVKILSNLPDQFVTFESKPLNDEIGYIKFSAFALTNVDKFCGAISQFKNKKAIVIDMRGNIGGNFGALFGITSLLTDKRFIIGTEINKAGKEPRFINPQLKNFKGKLAVLTDAQSYSAAEIFASGLKENNRATIIGDKTAGSALPSLSIVLPTGAVFLYPIANFETPKGNLLEGKGVEPNIKISLDRKSLLEGKDVQLDTAVNFLNDEIKKSATEIVKDAGNLDTVDEPPPPPAIKSNKQPLILASVNIADAFKVAPKNVQEDKALKIIDEYIEAVGGRENLNKLSSFTASGTAEMKQAGATIKGNVEIYRKSPNKIAKVIKIEAVGEINEVFDGTTSFVQTDFMGTQKNELWANEINLASNFRELLDIREIYPSITYEAVYEKEGRKVHLIKAVTKQGSNIYFAFDTATKFLVSRAGIATTAFFDDYRKVGDLAFPFQISESIMTYKLTEVKPNAPVDDSRFVQKESCFTKID